MATNIAIYGKGGVGKTTIAANLSAAFASSGRRVLLIGCSPTADSSHLLTGEEAPVVLNPLLVQDGQIVIEKLITIGYLGVGCLEIGDPVASCGCSSKSIAASLDKLYDAGVIADFAPDFVIYDMPGDVGCIGEVTLRKHKVDYSLIATSASYQSIYAANRLITLLTSSQANRTVALVVNGSVSSFEDSLVEHFARQVGLTVAAAIPRSFADRHSELYGKTVVEAGPLSFQANIYRSLARLITDGRLARHKAAAKPLDAARLKEWAHEWGRRLGELEFGIISDGAGI
ncbi:MAG: nitrogenase iron protein [Geobacter sp.]|nr:nitrogenase iron protein [Geobacter sp.]